MPDPQELEGKFACGLDDLERVAQLERVGDFHLVRQDQRTQTDVYFDTDTLTLRRNSCSLRLREMGGDYKATFKGPRQSIDDAGQESYLIKRIEIEVPVTPAPTNEAPFIERTDLEPVSRAREIAGNGVSLTPIARLVTQRRTRNYEGEGGGAVELSLDNVEAVDLRDGRETRIIEVEIELISGDASALVSAATALREAIPSLRPSSHSKLARALGKT